MTRVRDRSLEQPVTADTGTPPDVTWWQSADGTAHAFRGLDRYPMCAAWWVVRDTLAPAGLPHDPDCELLLTGAPGEITEAFGR